MTELEIYERAKVESDRRRSDAVESTARACQVICSLLYALGEPFESYQPWLKLLGWACLHLEKYDWAASYAILSGEEALITTLPQKEPSNRNMDARIPWKLVRPDHKNLELHSTYGGEWEEKWIYLNLSEKSLDGLGNALVYLAKDRLEMENGLRYEHGMYPVFDLYLNATLVLARQSGFEPAIEKWPPKVGKLLRLGVQRPL